MRRALVVLVGLATFGCSDTESPSRANDGKSGASGAAGSSGASGFGGGAGSSGASGSAGATIDEVPGGEPEAGAIVGCDDAERPARALADPQPICTASAPGRCWYVAPNGNDSADGSFASPLRTPQLALAKVAPGDVVYLRGGVYGSEHSTVAGVVDWEDESKGVIRRALHIGSISLPPWAGGDAWGVASGTAEAPITIESFPGERACFDAAGSITIGSLSQETAHFVIRRITLKGGVVHVGGGSEGEGGSLANQTHHITIRESEIFDYDEPAMNNVGLVKVDRGDWGGPHEIVVRSNILHDLSVDHDGVIQDWKTTNDAQHFGAVTTLSRENYFGFEGGGTGKLEIENNEIYRTPSAFFFKNPMKGPIEIRRNRIREVQAVGFLGSANTTLYANLVIGVSTGWAVTGNDVVYDDDTNSINGHHAVVEHNTFVGLETLMSLRRGTGHTIRNNVFFGLTHQAASANWDTGSYLLVSENAGDPLDPAGSTLHQLTSDENCFVSASDGFQFAMRRVAIDAGANEWHLDHWDRKSAQALFGFDQGSTFVVETKLENLFADPSGGDYALLAGSACAGKGHAAAP